MIVATFKRGLNYWSTYYLLVKDYLRFLGARAIPILAVVIAAGLLYPLPFAIMAAAVYAMMAGHDISAITIGRWTSEVRVDSAFLYALILAGVTLTFQYLAMRVALSTTQAWQTSLLWRGVNQLPVMARWDTKTAIPLPLKLERLGGFLNSFVRSGFLVGRIVAVGLSNLVIALGSFVVLTWLDPISVAVLVLVALVCMPLYAWALLGLVGVRQRSARIRSQQTAMFKQVLQGILLGTARRIDTRQLDKDDASRFDASYGMINKQLQGINLISLIAGLHVFASIAIIYIINGASLSSFVRDKIIFFVILLFMMRAGLGLALLLSRLSRSYTSLATLRAFLHPRRKRVMPMPQAPADAVFSLAADGSGDRHSVCPGKPVFVVMPGASYAFELLPLSNALELVKVPGDLVLRHIVLLDSDGLRALLEGDQVAPGTTLEVSNRKSKVQLPVRYVPLERGRVGVVALTTDAWEFLVNGGEAKAFCRDRLVFVIISEPKRPKSRAHNRLLVVSDCTKILAVGPFEVTWETAAEKAFQAALKKDVRVDFEDEEELG